MDLHNIPWGAIFWGSIKLLKTFGIIPGTMAALGVRRWYQKWRQDRAMAGWPSTDATILGGSAHKEGMRHWAEVTYSYYVGEYRAGKYLRRFRREQDADEFLRQVKDKRVQVHYNPDNPDKSVILDRDVEMIVLLAPQYG